MIQKLEKTLIFDEWVSHLANKNQWWSDTYIFFSELPQPEILTGYFPQDKSNLQQTEVPPRPMGVYG